MEAGLPFICTDYILWKEIVDTYKCGLCVEPGNVEQIRNAIHYLVDHPKIAFEMGKTVEGLLMKNSTGDLKKSTMLICLIK